MPVDRKRQDRFSSDREQADKSIRIQMDFILANMKHLRKVDRCQRMENAALDFKQLLADGTDLTPGQRRYVEVMYEKCWAGAQFEAVNTHVDKKRRGLRFG